ncbi:EI24 domain-containing protein [Nocardioides sp.]|uniref:EI24 domain-containing protein n=1 Tax=Nocardioides sp. TaxID=35761 RepID=UPI002B276637|nr:EI24 domain-containing protein [Nocardioides sp.]
MTDLLRGAGYLRQGLTFLRGRPRLLLLGMVPGLIVFLVLGAAFVALLLNVADLVAWATPFSDDWADSVRAVVRGLLAIALLVGVLVLFSALFVALTLTVGDPFYERIWRETEASLGGPVPDHAIGFWQAARDGLRLVLVGLGFSALVLLCGLVPIIGPTVGIVLGVVFSGRLLARELLGRPLGARGLDDAAQLAATSSRRTTVLGFGIATQLCFLVPLGGILVMPAAVAGAAILARNELDLA